MTEPIDDVTTPATGTVRAVAAWLLLALAAMLVGSQALLLAWPPGFGVPVGGFASPLLSVPGVLMIAAPLLAALLTTRTGAATPAAAAVTLTALALYAATFLVYALYYLCLVTGGAVVFDTHPAGAVRAAPRVVVELLLYGLLATAAAYVVAVRRSGRRG